MRGAQTTLRPKHAWLAALCACGALLTGAAEARDDDQDRQGNGRSRPEQRDQHDDRRGGANHDRRDGANHDRRDDHRDHRDADRQRGRDDRRDHDRGGHDRRDWNRHDRNERREHRDWDRRDHRDWDRRNWHGRDYSRRDWDHRRDWWRDARYVTHRPGWQYYNGRYWAPPRYRGSYCTDRRHYHGVHYHVAARDYYEYYYPRYRYYGAGPVSATASVIISIPLF